jgi:hypothetical protein
MVMNPATPDEAPRGGSKNRSLKPICPARTKTRRQSDPQKGGGLTHKIYKKRISDFHGLRELPFICVSTEQ